MSIAAVKDFGRLLSEGRVREAFETYVDVDYIQHNPEIVDGREAAIAFLEPRMRYLIENSGSYDVQRMVAEDDLVVLHVKIKKEESDLGTALVDIFRFDKGKIVEHWDVSQPIPEHSANDHPMF